MHRRRLPAIADRADWEKESNKGQAGMRCDSVVERMIHQEAKARKPPKGNVGVQDRSERKDRNRRETSARTECGRGEPP